MACFFLIEISEHNIIQIHNNVLWDSRYFTEYFSNYIWMWGTFYEVLLVPQNIVMNLNNVMLKV